MSAMTMRIVRDPNGGVRHVPAPFLAVVTPAARGRKKAVPPDPIRTNGESSAEQLRLFIERIERVNEEIVAFMQDRADIFAEAKSTGFDPKAMKAVLALRRTEKHVRDEHDMLLETYRNALGLA